MSHPVDNHPRPGGCLCGGHSVTTASTSTSQRSGTFFKSFEVMHLNGEEGLSWHHIEDVGAYDEDVWEMLTAPAGERESFSEHAYEKGPSDDDIWREFKKKGFLGFGGVRKRVDMREYLRPVAKVERGARQEIAASGEESCSKKGVWRFGFGVKGKGKGKDAAGKE